MRVDSNQRLLDDAGFGPIIRGYGAKTKGCELPV